MWRGFIIGLAVAGLLVLLHSSWKRKQGPEAWQIEKVQVMKLIQEYQEINDAEQAENDRQLDAVQQKLQETRKKSVDSKLILI